MNGSLPLTPTEPLSLTFSNTDVDADLVERAKGDREAFGRLYERYYPLVANYVLRRIGDRSATEEIVSDVFFAVLTRLGRFRWRRVPFHHWVLRIATNAVRRRARSHRRREELHRRAAPNDAPDEPANAKTSSRDDDVQEALLGIAIRFQEVLVLHHVEGLEVREVAAIVGCRPGTVKSRLSRGRDALRERLEARVACRAPRSDPR